MPTIKIIGLGNAFCADDAVGIVVARQLLPYESPSVSIIEGGLAGLTLLHEMEGTDKLILIDAVSSQSEIGTLLRFTIPQDLDTIGQLAWSTSGSSTHDWGLGAALTLAETLSELPPSVVIYGIEIATVQQGFALSPKVAKAIQTVVTRIVTEELGEPTCTNSN
ncbi:MAG: hydrogenase [Nitrospirales bacterium]|nr:MAG: hydrogenase [Nitrospirales bacterium]